MTHEPINTPDEPAAEPIDLNEHRRRTGRAGEPDPTSDAAPDVFDAGTGPGTELDIRDTGSDVSDRTEYGPDGLPVPEVLEGELVDGPDLPALGEPVWKGGANTRPILPAWLTSVADLKTAAGWVWSYTWRTTAFHAVRLPVYAGKLALRSPRGGYRVTRTVFGWVFDAEGSPVRSEVIRQGNYEGYVKLTDRRNDRVRLRLIVAGLGLLAALVAYGVFTVKAPDGAGWLLLALVVALLGWAGAPADRPLIGRAVVSTGVPKPTSDSVVAALASLRIPGISQAIAKGERINFPHPIRQDGPGWRADVDLPLGVTAGDVMDKRKELASGLRRPLGCVWPEQDRDEHPGRLVLWVGMRDVSKTRQPSWPLAKRGGVDLFRPVPFGTDQRGRWVSLCLMYVSAVIGAIPRMGKTFALRLLLLVAALDVRAELHVYDLKGTGDLSPLEPVAHRYRAGDDPADVEYAGAAMREVRTEMRRRTKVIRNLPEDVCPERKVTPALAGNKSLGLHPIVIGVDECQVWFEDATYGKELEEICTDLVKRGPALGISLILATQRPDKDSIPTQISANVSTRFCLKVMGQTENDMVLGTSAYKNGIRATTFSWDDKGIGYLLGSGADARIVRTVYLDVKDAKPIALRARAARMAAGRLTGHAAGEQPDTDVTAKFSLLEDVLAVVPASEPKVWSETVVTRLAELRPEVYAGWKPEQLAAALKPHGVTVGRQVWGTDPDTGKGANRKGIHRDDITAALTERNENRSAD